jgi:hypothetical protein
MRFAYDGALSAELKSGESLARHDPFCSRAKAHATFPARTRSVRRALESAIGRNAPIPMARRTRGKLKPEFREFTAKFPRRSRIAGGLRAIRRLRAHARHL